MQHKKVSQWYFPFESSKIYTKKCYLIWNVNLVQLGGTVNWIESVKMCVKWNNVLFWASSSLTRPRSMHCAFVWHEWNVWRWAEHLLSSVHFVSTVSTAYSKVFVFSRSPCKHNFFHLWTFRSMLCELTATEIDFMLFEYTTIREDVNELPDTRNTHITESTLITGPVDYDE